jgi:hypothetical protein
LPPPVRPEARGEADDEKQYERDSLGRPVIVAGNRRLFGTLARSYASPSMASVVILAVFRFRSGQPAHPGIP